MQKELIEKRDKLMYQLMDMIDDSFPFSSTHIKQIDGRIKYFQKLRDELMDEWTDELTDPMFDESFASAGIKQLDEVIKELQKRKKKKLKKLMKKRDELMMYQLTDAMFHFSIPYPSRFTRDLWTNFIFEHFSSYPSYFPTLCYAMCALYKHPLE